MWNVASHWHSCGASATGHEAVSNAWVHCADEVQSALPFFPEGR